MATLAPYAIVIRSNTGGARAAFTYDDAAHTLASVDSRASIETGADYWALKIEDDYSLIFDTDGLLLGDFLPTVINNDYPRLDFYRQSLSGNQHIASLSKQGRLYAHDLSETDALPEDSMNLYGNIAISASGVFATKLGEIHLLSSDGDYLTYAGKLIRVRQ
jgi:hypothetical protein